MLLPAKKLDQGEVLAVSPGVSAMMQEKLIPMDVKVGDRLVRQVFRRPLKLTEKEYLVMREEDIMGVLE